MGLKIGIVILTYRNVDDTVECLRSLKKIKGKFIVDIILVDNSPERRFLDQIKLAVDGYEAIHIDENNGYSSGNNVGIKSALERGCSHIVVINNDTVVDPDFLNELLSVYNSNANIGVVGPIILKLSDGTIWSTGGKFRRILCNNKMLYDRINGDRETEFINGCCFLASKEVFESVGFLKENYFMYGEDADFCLKLSKKGYRNIIASKSLVYHKVSNSMGVGSPFQTYYIYRNRLLLIRLNFRGIYRVFATVSNILQCLVVAVRFMLRGKWQHAKVVLLAVRDRKKEGKTNRFPKGK